MYHSALKRNLSPDYYPLQKIKMKEGEAFVFDLNDTEGSLPEEYNKCDVFYSEIPYKDGYAKFMNKVKSDFPLYKLFYEKVANILNYHKNIPSCFIGPKLMKSYLSDDFKMSEIKLNGVKENFFYRGFNEEIKDLKTNHEVMNYLSINFECVGDFCCGYGNTAEAFKKANKHFICSDVNPKAIGGLRAKLCALNHKEAEEFIEKQVWTFAKTMASVPHEYIVKTKMDESNKIMYQQFFNLIISLGVMMRWGRYKRPYLDIGKFRYWTMTMEVEQSIIINRELISGSKAINL